MICLLQFRSIKLTLKTEQKDYNRIGTLNLYELNGIMNIQSFCELCNIKNLIKLSINQFYRK